MEETLAIVPARLDDLAALQSISIATFTDTYAASNTPENMELYLAENFTEQSLRAELTDPSTSLFIAKIAEKIIGYLKLNYNQSQTELKDEETVEIERIYISKEFHGKKYGKALLDKAIEIAKSRNASYIWLGVWERNTRAISFYEKNNFVPFNTHSFTLGNDVQTDIMMKRALS